MKNKKNQIVVPMSSIPMVKESADGRHTISKSDALKIGSLITDQSVNNSEHDSISDLKLEESLHSIEEKKWRYSTISKILKDLREENILTDKMTIKQNKLAVIEFTIRIKAEYNKIKYQSIDLLKEMEEIDSLFSKNKSSSYLQKWTSMNKLGNLSVKSQDGNTVNQSIIQWLENCNLNMTQATDSQNTEFLFADLPEPIQHLALEKHMKISHWEDYYNDDLAEALKSTIEYYGIEIEKRDLSLQISHSQGDYVEFNGRLSYENWLKSPRSFKFYSLPKKELPPLLAKIDKYFDTTDIRIKARTGRDNVNIIFYDDEILDYDEALSIEEKTALRETMEEINSAITQSIEYLISALLTEGTSFIENIDSEEYQREEIIANEYMFDAEGNRV